ncbi:MAG TPA: hypothetical protein VG755_15950 [Nannocystaceae bacterium]|nr:hypothetical protein [Nannocystaceae bacterium]
MGLFGKRARECDWCGRAIEGAGIVDGDLVLCSDTCLDHKNNPAAAAARTVPDIRNATIGLAQSDLAIAVSELERYEEIAKGGATSDPDTLTRARNAYFTLWRQLAQVRRLIAQRGAEIAEFDRLHRSYLDTAEVVDVSRGQLRQSAVATFPVEDRERARAAVAALQRAIAKLDQQ